MNKDWMNGQTLGEQKLHGDMKGWTRKQLVDFLEVDYWDTYEFLINPPKTNLSKKEFKQRQIVMVWFLNATFESVCNEINKRVDKKKMGKKWVLKVIEAKKKQEGLKPFTIK